MRDAHLFLPKHVFSPTVPGFSNWKFLISWPSVCLELAIPILIVALYRIYFSALSDIPGPFWASVTRLWHVRCILKGKQNLRFKELHERYGQFVRVAPNEVSVNHPHGALLLLHSNLHKGEWYRVTAVPDVRFQNPMAIIDPQKNKDLAKHFKSSFIFSKLLRSEPQLDENIVELFNWMNKYAAEQKPMNLDMFLTYTTFDNTSTAFISEPLGFIKEGRDIDGTIENNIAMNRFAAVAGFFMVPLRILVNPLNSWILMLPMGKLFASTSATLKRRLKNPDSGHDILSHWLDEHKKYPDQLTFRHIEAQANVILGAGPDTTSAAIQSILYHMLKHPASWLKVRSEIDDAQTQGLCLDPVISFRDAAQLPYLEASFKEALRIFTPASMGLPRVAPKSGITIGDRHFKEGITLSISPQVVHASKEIWGANANEFIPERWLSGKTKEMETNWLAFSAGYTLCPGRHLAKLQVLKMVASMIRDYDIHMVDPNSEWKYQANFTAIPHSWPVYIQRRECGSGRN